MADYSELAALLKAHAPLVVDALQREADRRTKVATKASLDTTFDPAAVVEILRQGHVLMGIAMTISDEAAVPMPERVIDVATHGSAEVKQVPVTVSDIPEPQVPRVVLEDVEQQDAQVRNVLDKIMTEAPADPPADDSTERHYGLSQAALDNLLGDENDEPLPEDAGGVSAQLSVAHADTFTETREQFTNRLQTAVVTNPDGHAI